ncbi:exodeoxyribonuclease V subunit beta [Pseudorhodoferax sp. Leaf267]|uniref:exodeoxyribonuclease V subunit beta n=1 Tax=Pseudorhodoferax sp. Leaf267 TaxID=1736316 RepID=UPI0006FD5EF1|nr:exodeoxyribonuclease V subunit beta [Pseudorhodoferax sp. Leaf267]KQP13082.1 exodeoxyribonuclease V subunit beta [Pseudorhodoferax sp. Leaf267]
MTSLPELLQPLRLPLRGSRLIEASAGTGKTFTIAALYLRLVLGHGGDAAFARPLTPPEILVVTFTEAATQELRDRIRARLAEAADAFLADPADMAQAGNLLHDLRADYPPAQWPACARTLRLAAEWMDEAAVSTIHGWCNRMLREHAFDSGSPFTQTLQTDQSELQAEVVRDYWRSFCTPLAPDDAAQVRAWWATPEQLQADVGKLLEQTDALGAGEAPATALKTARDVAARELAALKGPWAGETGWAAELLRRLEGAVAAKHCKLPKRKDWMQALRDWAEGDAPEPGLTKTAWERLCIDGLADGWAGDSTELAALFDHAAWPALASLRARLKALPDGRHALLRHAARWCAQRQAQEQARRAEMGFNELLTRLDAALQGPNGARLAALIRRQFPAALIDEFQDTDPLQYRIFDTIYRVAANAPETVLLLIGDPKQAIYAFRGADIHTYLAARHATAGRHATLGTNYRSTAPMVQAVNAVFDQAELRLDGQGAFGFRTADGNPLPFVPVQAQGRAQRWWHAGREPAALTAWVQDAGPDATGRMAAACASEIVRLLNAGQAGEAGFRDPDGTLRALRPGDIAVLVNKGAEARAVRQALGARGVRSVYLSEQDSVFDSPVAAELQLWLAACATPEDERLLRAALASALLGLDWQALDDLGHDALQWEARVLQFGNYQRIWQRQGVLPMLRHLLHDFGVPQRLLAAGDERMLTDALHLAELLQQASSLLDGEHALIRWLAEQRAGGAGGDADARRLRLQSDADLLKVVTVHKSKGLEYPLVFLPFATALRAAKADDLPLKWHDDDGRLVVALQADAEDLARVDAERLGEDLRKLYVALTRARYATWVGVTATKDVERSALGYLLGGGAALPPDVLRAAWQSLAGDAIAVQDAPAPDAERYHDPARTPVLAPEPPLPAGPLERWWIASYSALRRAEAGPEAPAPLPESAAEDIYADSRVDDADDLAEDAIALPAADAGSLHAFPRGAAPGTLLHGLLEWMGQQGFARVQADAAVQAELAERVARACALPGYAGWAPVLQDWLLRWVAMPLQIGLHGAAPVAPAALGTVQIEMEFWLAAQQVDTRVLDDLVRGHTLDAAPRPALAPQQVHGMLKGYIDLVFVHEGRYYVADYKSNWLGPLDADYHPATMRAAVLAHRYELQYVLYVFALHRLLRARLPGYDYAQHMGGSATLFLRGHAAPGQGLHAECPPWALIEALDALFQGQAEVA